MNVFPSVTELTRAISQTLKRTLQKISVKGEVCELKRQSSGHIYFSLKDENAKISAVLFRGTPIPLKNTLKDGDIIESQGSLAIYAPRGSYQIIMESAQYAGVGDAQRNLQALFQKIKQLGWYDDKHKQPLPPFPQRFGIITSPSGAVLHDVIHVLSRKQKKFHLLLHPVSVQGPLAAQEIVQAIQNLNAYHLVDIILLVRGGGSPEDLAAFNTESVAEAILKSKIPIVSGVGHETDISICDFVADIRAPTPSAAAETAAFSYQHILENLNKYSQFFQGKARHKIELYQNNVERCKKHPKWTEKKTPSYFFLKLQDIQDSIFEQKAANIKHQQQELQKAQTVLKTYSSKKWINNKKSQIAQIKVLCIKNSATLIGVQKQRLSLMIQHSKRHPQNYITQKTRQLRTCLRALSPKTQQNKKRAVQHIKQTTLSILQRKILTPQNSLKKINTSLTKSSKKFLLEKMKDLNWGLKNLKKLKLKNKSTQHREEINNTKTKIKSHSKLILQKKKWQLNKIKPLIQSLKPESLLKKGFSIVFAEKGNSVILSKKMVSPGMPIVVRVSDGEILARVERVIK